MKMKTKEYFKADVLILMGFNMLLLITAEIENMPKIITMHGLLYTPF